MHLILSPQEALFIAALLLSYTSLGCSPNCDPPPLYGSLNFGPPECLTLYQTRLQGTLKGIELNLDLQTAKPNISEDQISIRFFDADGRSLPTAKIVFDIPKQEPAKYNVPLTGSLVLPNDPTTYVFRAGSIWLSDVVRLRQTWYHLVVDEGIFNGCYL